ncbi:MAG: hypothetical protein ABIF92_00765 [archaeon]
MNLLQKLKESEVMRPSVLVVFGTLIFVALSAYQLSFAGAAVIILSLGAFVTGDIIGFKKFKGKAKVPGKWMKTVSLAVFLVSLTAIYFDFFTAGGVPLLNESIRRFLNPVLTSLAFLMVPANAMLITTLHDEKYAKLKTIFFIGFTAGMMALLGYRTEVLAALISGVLVAYYSDIFEFKEIVFFALAALLAMTGMTILRHAGITNYRSATTMAAFDFLVEKTDAIGLTHGSIQFADFAKIFSKEPVLGGRNLVATIIGSRPAVSITSTLFGPPFADFGFFALIEFFLIGLLTGASYKAAKTRKGAYAAGHAIILTFLLLGIETGITDLIVWTYFIAVGGFFAYSQFISK